MLSTYTNNIKKKKHVCILFAAPATEHMMLNSQACPLRPDAGHTDEEREMDIDSLASLSN